MQIINGNYVDLIIILILIYYATEAFRHGLWVILADFFSFLLSLIFSLRFYIILSDFLKLNFDLSVSLSKAVGFLVMAILFETILSNFFGYLIHSFPNKIKNNKASKYVGILLGIGEGLLLISAFLVLLVALPIKPQVKEDISESKIGSILLTKTSVFETALNEVFGGVINESLTFFTISTNNDQTTSLDVRSFDLSNDEKAEIEMFIKVNEERKKIAIPELVWNPDVVPVARMHAKDMWERKYFSHFSPEGKDVGDRLQLYKVKYTFAGENLALAPTTISAHTGLMNSKGHRENILDSRFKKVGIGVIDNKVYGKMYVQIFTD